MVFDFNGTQFSDPKLHNRAWDLFLDSHGIRLSDADKHAVIHGKNNREIMTQLFNADLPPEGAAQLIQEKEAIYRQICQTSNLGLAPGAADFMSFLKQHRIQSTIATASGWENLCFYVDRLKLGQWFDLEKIVYDDGTVKSKPAPDFFLKACENLSLDAGDVIIFEDSRFGITAAENAGAGKVIIVASNEIDYGRWHHEKIGHFNEVDRDLLLG